MRHSLLILLFIAFFSTVASAQSAGDYRSNGSGDWSTVGTWEVYDGTAWGAAVSAPDETDGVINVRTGHTVTITTDVVADQLLVLNGATLTVDTSGSLTLNDGPDVIYIPPGPPGFGDPQIGDMVIVEGTIFAPQNGKLNVNGSFIYTDNTNLANTTINTEVTGLVDHALDGDTILNATWQEGSTIRVSGMTSTTPSGLNQLFYNFEWDCSGQLEYADLANQIPTIQNDLSVVNTGVNTLFLSAFGPGSMDIGHDLLISNTAALTLSAAGNYVLTVVNDVLITANSSFGMTFCYNNSTTMNVGGDMIISNDYSIALSLGSGSGDINVKGDFLQNDGNFAGQGTLTFEGSGLQNLNLVNNPLADVNFVIESGSIVDIGTSYFSGPGDLTLNSGGVLRVGSTSALGAINASTTSGNVRLSGNRIYQNSGRIIYNGADAQFIGAGHPANPTLEIINSNNVTLADNISVNGPVILTDGDLVVEDNTLTLGNTITANGNFIQTTNASSLVFNGNGITGTFPFPAGDQFVNNVTVNRTSGYISFDAPVTIEGVLTLTAGSLRFSDLTHNSTSDISSGNLYALPGASLKIGGSDAYGNLSFSPAGNTLDTFILQRTSGTLTLTSTMNIGTEMQLNAGSFGNPSGLLVMSDGATLIKDSNATITGDSPNITSGTYNVTYVGVAQTTGPEIPSAADETSLGHLIINGGPVTLDQELYINNGIELNNSSLLSGGNTIYVRGDWTKNAGSFNSGGSTVIFDGTTVITATSTPNFGEIQIDEVANVTFPSGNINIAGILQIDAGATFNHNNGTVVFTGTSAQTIGVGGAHLFNITVNNSGNNVDLSSTLNLEGRLRFQSQSIFNSGGNLVLISTSDAFDTGNASIGNLEITENNYATITGNVTVQRYMSAEELGNQGGLYRYITPTVSGATVAGWQDDFAITGNFAGTSTGPGLTNNASMFYYNEGVIGGLEAGYVAYPSASSTESLDAGRGYAAWVFDDAPVTLDLTGTVVYGDFEIPVTRTSSGDASADGWNLVGNPYPSSIDWDNAAGWDKSDVYGTVVVKDNGSNGIYRYWNGTDAGDGMRTALPGGRIATGQAFWVNAANDGSLWVGEAAKTSTTAEFFREGAFTPNRLIIALDKGQKFDETLIVVSRDATNGYDPELDIPKFSNNAFNISTFNAGGKKMAFNYVKTASCEQEVGIDISNAKTGDYELSFREIQSFEQGYELSLIDNFTGSVYNLREQQSFMIHIDENNDKTFGADRLQLVIGADIAKVVDLETAVEAAGNVCQGENASVTLPSASGSASYQLYLNDEIYGEPQTGNTNLTFEVSSEDMLTGSNHISLMATVTGCGVSAPLKAEIEIQKENITPEITVEDNVLRSNYEEGNQWYFEDEPIEGATGQEYVATINGDYSLEVTTNGCSARVSEQLIVTGSDELFEGQIRIYPNPANAKVNVSVNFADNTQQAILRVYNSVGELMLQKSVTNDEYSLNVDGWKEGMYLVQIVSNGDMQIHRLIKR